MCTLLTLLSSHIFYVIGDNFVIKKLIKFIMKDDLWKKFQFLSSQNILS